MTTSPAAVATRPQALRDSLTMLGRQLRHVKRYPELSVIVVALPIVFLLLFVYVFGGTLGAGLIPGAGPQTGGRAQYANYVVPAILVMTIASIATGTSVTVAMDMTGGIIARFRTMSIAPGSVLAGHAFGAVLQAQGSLLVLLGVSFLVGFRPSADVGDWLAAAALLTGLAFAVAWLSVACGLVSRTVESASNYPMPLVLLPFLGSGFVPTESMPGPLAWFAEHQPFTPIMDTLRALLLGTALDARAAWLSAVWCLALTVVGYLWARRAYARPHKV
ncbi:MAG TPA: ABC transporter permease [Actinomycetales bacterium]|nr:ABC transporter permease [Actinomycetales bacterium]